MYNLVGSLVRAQDFLEGRFGPDIRGGSGGATSKNYSS